MRKPIIVATTLVALLVPASPALAESGAEIKLLTSKAGKWSGFQVAAALEEQQSIKSVAIAFAGGSRIDLSRAPACEASRDERSSRGHREVCPDETLAGVGIAEATSTEGQKVNADLELWNVDSGERGHVLNLEQYAGETRFAPVSGFVTQRRFLTWEFGTPFPITEFGVRVEKKVVRTPRCGAARRWKHALVLTLADGSKTTLNSRQRCRR